MPRSNISHQSRLEACEGCGEKVPSYDIVNVGSADRSYRHLCTQCFNAEVAHTHRLENFENFRLDRIVLTDVKGKAHEFHFRTHLFGAMVSLEAFELKRGAPSGYQFQILGDPDEEILSLLARLIERMRRALAVKHLKNGKYGLQIADQTVRGRIGSDKESGVRTPMLTIDGQEISWEEFGRMLMTFEGWQFRMEIADRSEEV
jgi:hypothetical protein